MSNWNVNLMLKNCPLQTIQINNGIFQGDSLSPTWFCLALNPLSTLRDNTQMGYRLDKRSGVRISHMLYMDDIKLFAESRKHLTLLLDNTKSFSDSIGMAFGLDKCAVVSVNRGKIERVSNPIIDIDVLPQGEIYKYLGIEHLSINHTDMKLKFKQQYIKRVTKMLNTKLNGKNLITAINSWAIPALTYSSGVIKWSQTDLDELDRRTRVLLTKFRCLHPNSAIERLYLPRNKGGRGLLNIKRMCNNEVDNLRRYFYRQPGQLTTDIIRNDTNATEASYRHGTRR